jgi:pre-mRNA-splicing factor SYF1
LKILTIKQSSEDAIYEQDVLRDPGSVKPWLAYIEFKLQQGSLHEQAFVRGNSNPYTP